jgi:hypothetical protein
MALSGTLISAGCGYTTFQSPKVLAPGEYALGLGLGGDIKYLTAVTGELDEDHGDAGLPRYVLDIIGSFRFGLPGRLEGGVAYLPPFGGILNFKHQMLSKPVLISGDIGFSYVHVPEIGFHEGQGSDAIHLVGVHPALLIGSEECHIGLLLIHRADLGEDADRYTTPGITVGGRWGDRSKVLAQIGFYHDALHSGKIITMAGIGVERTLGLQRP